MEKKQWRIFYTLRNLRESATNIFLPHLRDMAKGTTFLILIQIKTMKMVVVYSSCCNE